MAQAHDLGAPRLLAFLSTDKPLYKPGETLYARALLLDAFTRAPDAAHRAATFELLSPKGDVAKSAPASFAEGVAALELPLPADMSGGEHTLRVKFPADEFPPAELPVSIRAYRPPRLRSDVEFVRKAYGPGDTVSVTLKVTRAEGGVPAGAPVTAVATVDGAEVHRAELHLDEEGALLVSFPLPAEIDEGEGTLALIIRDGGVQETTARTIPIAKSRVQLSFYPEGGDLIAGLPCRLYFEARTSKGKPADIAGRVIDKSGATVAELRSEHEGRGRATFTPQKPGVAYMAVLTEPAGIGEFYPLPEVQRTGYALRATTDGGTAGDPVVLEVTGTIAGKARVSLSQRDREVASFPLNLTPGVAAQATLTPPESADGVLRATVLDASGVPRAERLIFQRPAREVKVEVTARPARAGLRDPVQVTVRTTSGDGKPVPALVTVAAVDDAVCKTIERRERPPRLPAQVLLGADVTELCDADAYLGAAAGDEGPRRVDLLLGTQGWRRFAFRKITDFLREHKDAGRRVVADRRPPPPPPPVVFRAMAMAGGFPPPPAPMMPGGPPPPRMMAMPAAMPAPAPAPVLAAAPMDMDEINIDAALGLDVQGEGAPAFDFMEAEVAAPAPDMPAAMQEVADDMAPPMAPPPMAAAMAMPAPAPMMAPPPAPPMPKVAEEEPGLLDKVAGFFGRARRQARPAPPRPVMPPPPVMPPQPMPVAPPPRVLVREFAHRAAKTAARTDFAETLLWHPALRTDRSGEARLSFDLCDSVTTFAVRADAVDAGGALGRGDAEIEARRPFYLEPKLPLEVTAGDTILLPLALSNGTSRALSGEVAVTLSGPLRGDDLRHPISLQAEGGARVIVPLQVGDGAGEAAVQLKARAGDQGDDVRRALQVAPAGFPFEITLGGRLEGRASHRVTIPKKILPGSLFTEGVAYPTPAASLQQAVEALLREPCGCFEQTSSSTYPNIMVLHYLRGHSGVKPALVKRASDLIDKGYKRLVSFECKERGYEWFGGDPGHEALTAYGLMEFADMAQVAQVDTGMIERTRTWLLSRRDGKGGFRRNDRALDTFGRAPAAITDAYITWALGQAMGAGIKDLAQEIDHVRELARKSNDPYLLALAANVLLDAGRSDEVDSTLDRLLKHQTEDGSFTGAKTSITSSSGESLLIETTSLAILALLRSPPRVERCERAMRWLLERCKGGRFGATQATILALRAIVAYDAAHATPRRDGSIRLRVDGKEVGVARFTGGQEGPVLLLSFGDALTPGEHEVELSMEGGAPMPYSLRICYNAEEPASAPECQVDLSTALLRTEVREGETVDLQVELRNRGDEGLPMVVAILGLPGGLEARADQLKELVKEGKIDFFETRGREVILYRRGMAPGERSRLLLSLVAAVPGRYRGPASRAYLYYTDEHKRWVEPLTVDIRA